MQEVMVILLGGGPLHITFGDNNLLIMRSNFRKSGEGVSIAPSSPNSEMKITIPVILPELNNAEATATFNYQVGHDGNFAKPSGGLKFIIE